MWIIRITMRTALLLLLLSPVAGGNDAVDPVRLDPGGRFGSALDASGPAVAAPSRLGFHRPPITVELWAKLAGKTQYNILIACAPKESSAHWELYTAPGTGHLTAYLPGFSPDTINTGFDIADEKWRHVAMTLEPNRARIYVDGRVVADAPIAAGVRPPRPGPLWFGSYPPGGLSCSGLIDDVRISRGVRPIGSSPRAPHELDAETLGVWTFDAIPLEDRSDAHLTATTDAARVAPEPVAAQAGPSGDGPTDYRAADPRLAVELLDRVAGESLLSVRADAEGRLFVGGREALFVYEPEGAEGYEDRRLIARFPEHSWINDVAIRGDDLYVMTNAALYLLEGARTKYEGVKPRRLVWGWPVDLHVTLHGMAWGLDGDLYFVAGDPLLNYGDFAKRPDHWGHWMIHSMPEGSKTPYTGQGGIFRVRPDGSNLRVVARGLRGAFGLCKDRRGEMFTCDNDHESLAAQYSPARLLHAVPNADFAWPRGWTADKQPDRSDLLKTMYEGTGLGREVPVGISYYDDVMLPEPYRDSLLLARWGQRRIDAFRLIPRGASFGVEERPLLIGENTARPVGVTAGPSGEVLAVVCYMENNEWSPAYVADLIRIRPRGVNLGVRGWNPMTASEADLIAALSAAEWSRREVAHIEILRRAEDNPERAARLAEMVQATRSIEPGLRFSLLASANNGCAYVETAKRILGKAESTEAERLAVLRGMLNVSVSDGLESLRPRLIPLLSGPSGTLAEAAMRVLERFAGSLTPLEIEAIVRGPARSADSYLRLPATGLLARRLDPPALGKLLNDPDPAVRLAGVLAAGQRLTIPAPDLRPPEAFPLRYEAKNAEFVLTYADATVDLKSLGRIGSFTIAEVWNKARTNEAVTLAALLIDRLKHDPSDAVVLQAATYLHLLDDSAIQPLVDQARQRVAARRLAAATPRPIDRFWRLGPIPETTGEPAGPVDLSQQVPTKQGPASWEESPLELPARRADNTVIEFYTRLQSTMATRVRIEVGPESPRAAWLNGHPVHLSELDLQAGSNDLLLRFGVPEAQTRMVATLHAVGSVSVVLPERLGLATLAERLKQTGPAGDFVPSEFAEVDWSRAVAEGDADRGRKLFSTDALGCARCHAIRADDPTSGGPSLAGASERFTIAHVVESVLLPGRQVAPEFQATSIATEDGEVLTGLITTESEATIELLLPDASRRTLRTGDVAERKRSAVSPMPAGLVRTPEELRDLLAFLLRRTP